MHTPNAFVARVALAALVVLCAGFGPAAAAVKSRVIEYTQGGTTLVGYVAWDDATPAKRPGVLVAHEWWGHNDHARKQAERLAAAGFVGFALDMYGKGKVAKHPTDAKTFMQEATKDPAVLQARFDAALVALKAEPLVDTARIGAIGYCFGGRIVLDMAQRGAPLFVAGSFHGAIPEPAEKPVFNGRVLVFNGAADPMIPAEAVAKYVQALAANRADFQFFNLPGAKHAFTNPDADKAGVDGLGYSKSADEASFAAFVTAARGVLP
jgi:dienelactone hydrolase